MNQISSGRGDEEEISPIDPERALNPYPELMRRTVGISGVSFQGRKLPTALVDWNHAREFEGPELCIERVDGVPVSISRYTTGDELGGNLLLPLGQLRSGARGAYTCHVSECIDKIELLQNIESSWSAFSTPETNPFQGSYGGDGRRAVATECMGNNTKERTSDVFSVGVVGTHE